MSNRDSTFAELLKIINQDGPDGRSLFSKYWKVTLNPLMLTCINGNQVIFRGTNDERQREKLKSITFGHGKLTDIWIEEMTELSQTDFEILDDRLRGNLPDGQFYQIKGTFNPVTSTHWIKKVFFDRQDENTLTHHSTWLDNRFIDAGYKARMLRRKEVDPEGYQVYGLGEWGESGGLIFTNWTVENISQNPEEYDDVAQGQDFGFNHPNVILQLGMKGDDVYIYKEFYKTQMDTMEIIKAANAPKDIIMWCESAEPDRTRLWHNAGYKAVAVSKERGTSRSINAQIDWLKQRRIFVHPSCVNTIKELQQWKWIKDQVTSDYTDTPVAIFDDAMSALRYGVEGWRKPRGVRVNLFSEGI